jgi:hypothetical protein
VGAHVLADGYFGAWGWRRTGLRLANAGRGQGAERGERAGGKSGAAQEAAPIELAGRARCQGGRQRPAASTAISFLDQHALTSWGSG